MGDCRVQGFGTNQDGRSMGLTAPNGPAQTKLLQSILRDGSSYQPNVIEIHGTGTSLGDPIEIQALHNAFLQNNRPPMVLTSSKTMFGHAETVAGILGVLKILHMFNTHKTCPNLHFKHLNAHIGSDLIEAFNSVLPLEAISMPSESQLTAFGNKCLWIFWHKCPCGCGC